MRKRYAALAVAVFALAVFAPTASADPVNAKNSLAFPATCDNGQTVQVVVNGNGEFSPAHVVGSTAVFVPQLFDITFEFTPPAARPRLRPTQPQSPTSTVTSSPAASTSPDPCRSAPSICSGQQPASLRRRRSPAFPARLS